MTKLGLWNSGNTGQFFVNTPSISQDFNWTRGDHAISFGGSSTAKLGRGRPVPSGRAIHVQRTRNERHDPGERRLESGRFPARLPGGVPAGGQPNQQRVRPLARRLCERYLACQFASHRQLRRPLGTLLGAEDRNGFTTRFSRDNFDKGIRSVVYRMLPSDCCSRAILASLTTARTATISGRRSHRVLARCQIRVATVSRQSAWDTDILRLTEVVDDCSPYAERTVRQYRGCAFTDIVSRADQQKWLPGRSLGSLEFDARRRSAGLDQLSDYGPGGSTAAAKRSVPDDRRLCEHAARCASDAVVSFKRTVPTRDAGRRARGRDVHG